MSVATQAAHLGKKAVGSPHTSIRKKRGGKREESEGEGGERGEEKC